MNRIIVFFESPSNRTGFVMLLSVLPSIVNQFADGNTAISGLIGAVCFGLLKILQPDNTAAIAAKAVAASNPMPAVSGKP